MKHILILLLLLVAPYVHAENLDDGLYDPAPPAGSAFIRFINAGNDSVAPSIGDKQFDTLETRQVSAYFVFGKGDAEISFGEQSKELKIEEGQFYSAILNEGLFVLTDTPNTDRTKSQIQFYNFSTHEALSLKTADGKVTITEGAAPNENRVRPINAVKLETALYKGDAKVGEPSTINLKRGMVHSAFVFPETDKIIWVTNTTDTTK